MYDLGVSISQYSGVQIVTPTEYPNGLNHRDDFPESMMAPRNVTLRFEPGHSAWEWLEAHARRLGLFGVAMVYLRTTLVSVDIEKNEVQWSFK